MIEEVASRLLVVMDDKSFSDDSFIRLGPVLYLQNVCGETSVCVVNRAEINIPNIRNVADIDMDAFEKRIVDAISQRKQTLADHSTFDSRRPGHIIKLIVGLIQHYGALTQAEIDVFLFAIDIRIPYAKIADYLLCAINAEWIVKDRRGFTEYYYGKSNIAEAIQYKVRKDIPFENRDRWRARVIEYWKENDSTRFNVIQSALKSSL